MNTKLPNFGGTSASGNDSKYFQTTKKGAAPRRRAGCTPFRAARAGCAPGGSL